MPPKRHRTVSVKPSRTGCRTCRIRKVKCDENRPECERCIRTGRNCDGYSPIGVNGHEQNGSARRRLLPLNPCIQTVSPTPTTGMTVQLPIDAHEKIAYEFFLQNTVHVLWHTSPVKKWIQLALQFGVQEEPIFYAVTALGSIHRAQTNFYHHTFTQPSLSEETSGLRQYSKATLSLQRYIDGAISQDCPLEPVLLCCLLFVCFETFRGKGNQALTHLRLGRSLFGLADDDDDPGDNITNHSLIARNYGLLTMFEIFGGELDVAPKTFLHQTYRSYPLAHHVRSMPTYFASIELAKECLRDIMADSTQFQSDIVELAMRHPTQKNMRLRDAVRYCIAYCMSRTIDISQNKALCRRESNLKQAYSVWLNMFDRMNSQLGPTRSENLALMEMQHFLSRHILETCRESREESMDRFIDDYTRVLSLAEQYLATAVQLTDSCPNPILHKSAIDPEQQRSFSLEDGVLPMLYFISLKCRSRDIRYRAIELLRSADRREGLHHSRVLADRALDIAGLEETRGEEIWTSAGEAGCKIPEAARFSDVIVESVSPFDSRVICGRYLHEADGGLEISEYRRYRGPFVSPEPIWKTIITFD